MESAASKVEGFQMPCIGAMRRNGSPSNLKSARSADLMAVVPSLLRTLNQSKAASRNRVSKSTALHPSASRRKVTHFDGVLGEFASVRGEQTRRGTIGR